MAIGLHKKTAHCTPFDPGTQEGLHTGLDPCICRLCNTYDTNIASTGTCKPKNRSRRLETPCNSFSIVSASENTAFGW